MPRPIDPSDLTPFGAWLQTHGISFDDAARALDVTRAYVWYLARGHATPRLALAFTIRNWTRSLDPKEVVSVDSWEPFCEDVGFAA